MGKFNLLSKASVVFLCVVMLLGTIPFTAMASSFDTTVSNDYYTVISNKEYALAPGVSESEIIVNNKEGNDRKIVHVFEVDATNPTVKVLPGYYGIDKLDPNNLALDGVADKTQYWTDKKLTETVAYYENQLGYNVVGAMNTALAYDSNAPYGYMVWDGVVLGTPEVHKGAQTYLAIYKDGTAELRAMSTPLDGNEWTAISANFGWLVKDGKLTTTTVERVDDASRSMIGIKADGTLVFCQVDGRNTPTSTGLSNYEMGEMMLSLGCVNAVNCDGGGSSTFVSKREGETENTMRSIPSDGAERPTINSVIIATTAVATGIFDHANVESDYDYYAAGSTGTFTAVGLDSAGFIAELPEEIEFALSDTSFGTMTNGVFTSNGKKGDVDVQVIYNNKVVGSKTIHVVDPAKFALALDETVLPYGKSMEIEFACVYGADNWAVCMDGAYTLSLSNEKAATIDGNKLIATSDESIVGVDVVATYKANTSVSDTLKVTYGKGSEIVFDFEDGDISNFLGVDEMYDWAEEVGASAPIQSNGNYSDNTDSETFLSTDIVRNGKYALGVTLDYTNATFASWSYNMFFYTGESEIVLRDVANGKNATTFGMWVYIPEGAAGLAMQIQGYQNPNGTGGTGGHFYFTTVSGAVKNLNSCTEADIPESRWVYATCDLTQFGDFFATYDPYGTNGREPSFIRFYVKPATAATLTFYFDDFTLDYSSAVEDRVLPTIKDVSYATQDESVALNEGAVINGNSIAFSAIVADNIKLDNATGKIYVDGNALANVAVSGKYLTTTSNVFLNAGVHTVVFEIKDTLGNTAKATRTFTVAGDAAVTLGGHNDSGAKPEYGSVYYVDVNVADITKVDKMNVSLALQTGNTWEPQGLVIAKGFKATYTLNKVEQILTITIERDGDAIDATATTLVSAPVRLWTWTGVNHVTDTPITPESQFATGYCPVIKVDCKVLNGLVNDTDFFGGKISVETMINDIVYPWHYHDKELTVLNKDATCFADGYTGRTYCETCKSVVDWGTVVEAAHSEELTTVNKDATCTEDGCVDGKLCPICNTVVTAGTVIPATGHTLAITEDFKLVCSVCNEADNSTGLVVVNGKTYCAISGNIVKGWQMIDNAWYHFNTGSGVAYNGTYSQAYFGFTDKLSFTFENGKLLSGAWSATANGNRYYYGPSYYKRTWATIDGEEYYFTKEGYPLTGYQAISPNLNDKTPIYNLFKFADDGKLEQAIVENGLYGASGKLFYVENGNCVYNRLVKDGDDYYYMLSDCTAAVNATHFVSAKNANGLLPAGTYNFGADGKLVRKNGFIKENGQLHYYINGSKQYGLGLLIQDGNYYYIDNSGIVATGEYYIRSSWTGNKLPTATYTFDENGKLIGNVGFFEVNGETKYYAFVKDDKGDLRYYINAKGQYGLGLITVAGDRYYVANDGIVATGMYYMRASWTNNVLPTATFDFGEDGRLKVDAGTFEVNGETKYYAFVKDDKGDLRYYINAKGQYGLGLIEVNGYRYYIGSNGIVATGDYYLKASWTENRLPTATYTFNEDGKLIINAGSFDMNGETKYYAFVKDSKGDLRYYINAKGQYGLGLIEVGGDRYYIGSDGIVATGEYYLKASWTGNRLPTATYTFNEDGKLIINAGSFDVNGETKYYAFVKDSKGDLRYYINAKGQYGLGLIEVDGDRYYIGSDGIVATGDYYLKSSWTNNLLPTGTYYFGEDGKLQLS